MAFALQHGQETCSWDKSAGHYDLPGFPPQNLIIRFLSVVLQGTLCTARMSTDTSSPAAHLCKWWLGGTSSPNDLVLSRKKEEQPGYPRTCTRISYSHEPPDWRQTAPCPQLETARERVQGKLQDPVWAEKAKLMGTGGQYSGSCKVGHSSMVKHRCLLFLFNPKCSMSGRAQPCPTRGLAHLVDSVHSQWGRMGHDLALCLSMSICGFASSEP